MPPPGQEPARPSPLTNQPVRTSCSFASLLRIESVAETPDCLDQLRATARGEFLAGARNMDVERVGLRANGGCAHRVSQLLISHELAATSHERREDAKLDTGQPEVSPGARRLALA